MITTNEIDSFCTFSYSQMSCLGFTLKFNQFKKHFLYVMGVSVVIILFISLFSLIVLMFEYGSNARSSSVTFILLLAQLAFLILYLHSLANIRIRFRLINVVIRWNSNVFENTMVDLILLYSNSRNVLTLSPAFIQERMGILYGPNDKYDVVDLLNELSRLHYKLNDGIRAINTCFSFQVKWR